MCFECVHYESLWWLACLCLCDMNETPGEQRCLDLFREEVLLSAVQQLWRSSYSPCNPTAAVALCKESNYNHHTKEWMRAELTERQIMFLYIAYTLWMYLVHLNTCEYTTLHLKFQHCTAYSMPKKWLITSLLGYNCNAFEQRTSLQRLMPAVTGLHDASFIICRWRLFYKQSSYTNLLWFQTELPSNIQSQWKWLNRSDFKKVLFTLSSLK